MLAKARSRPKSIGTPQREAHPVPGQSLCSASARVGPLPPPDLHDLVECRDCGLFQRVKRVREGDVAVCARCGATLRRRLSWRSDWSRTWATHPSLRRGPEITIRFKTAEGLVAQQTLVKYKAVPIGTVDDVELGPLNDGVIVHVRMQRSARFALTDHARFWVVRPRFSLVNLSALETLVSGAYIAVDPGPTAGKKELEFKGLEEPPGVTSDEPGRTFELRASRIGSLSEGAPVFYRDVTGAMSALLGQLADDVSLCFRSRPPTPVGSVADEPLPP